MAEQRQLGSGVRYLHVDGDALVWDERAEGAVMRLTSSGRAQVSRVVEHRFERLGTDGWEPVDEQSLAAWERGHVFYVSPAARQGQRLSRFESVRVLSEAEATQLLRDLSVRDEEGQLLPSAATAGRVFLLSARDATTFVERVRERQSDGWLVFGRPADPAALARAAAELTEQAKRAERLVAAVEQRFEQLAAGDGSGLVQLDEVAAQVWGLQRRGRDLAAQVERESGGLADAGASGGELVRSAEHQRAATAALARVERAVASFRAQQRRAAALVAEQRRPGRAGAPARAWRAQVEALLVQLAVHGIVGWITDDRLVLDDGAGGRLELTLPATTEFG